MWILVFAILLILSSTNLKKFTYCLRHSSSPASNVSLEYLHQTHCYSENSMPRDLRSALNFFLLLVILSSTASCVKDVKEPISSAQESFDAAVLQSLPRNLISYDEQVKPIVERRCVVCHGCYDAPCQLKLSSPAGIQRGSNKAKVYNGARILTTEPTRLFIDAKTTGEWRDKGFHSILNETGTGPAQNLEQSVMYRMLRLKELNPQPETGLLPDQFDLSLNRSQTCPSIEEMHKYEKKFPLQGMPFAMPNLKDEEFRTLAQWVAQGAHVPENGKISKKAASQLKTWESFFNDSDLKQQLVSRYLYEHLFQGHLHFTGTGNQEFYRLIRSSTPSGQIPDEIATVRPYGNPGGEFYYRLVPYPASIVAKDHVVYELSAQRMQRIRELFLEPDYQVHELPSWKPAIASNPFKAFAPIPPESRYKFLLDDARFFIEGFIKGPVCRGQIALNVIEDNFWVTFLDPEVYEHVDLPEFLEEMADYLEVPSAQEGAVRLLSARKDYRKRQQIFTEARFQQFAALGNMHLKDRMRVIWDGDGNNPNAALSIFRHFDSASVEYGFIGDYPETAWIIDYPQLERIHYLLVAGFNVYGNLKHQLNTRLYMDYLRMEGEDNFLSFIPASHRQSIRDSWYAGMRQGMEEDIGDSSLWASKDIITGYETDDPQRELYQLMEKRLAPVLARDDVINRCAAPPCHATGAKQHKKRVDTAMQEITRVEGITLVAFPDVAFIRVRVDDKLGEDLAYTIIRNKAYKNVTSIFKDEKDDTLRDYSEDTLTVVDWLEGSYPNFFFNVNIDDIEQFTTEYASLKSREDYEQFVEIYGVRRTNPDFWETADWFQDQYAREKPVLSGLFDLNRYEDR